MHGGVRGRWRGERVWVEGRESMGGREVEQGGKRSWERGERQSGDRSRQKGLELEMGQKASGEKEEGERREEERWGTPGSRVGVQVQHQRHRPSAE